MGHGDTTGEEPAWSSAPAACWPSGGACGRGRRCLGPAWLCDVWPSGFGGGGRVGALFLKTPIPI